MAANASLFVVCAGLIGCDTIPKPKGEIGVVHTKDVLHSYIHKFNMETDFDDDLKVIAGHNGVKHGLDSLADLDRHVCADAQSYANSLAAWSKLKGRYEDLKEKLNQCKVGK